MHLAFLPCLPLGLTSGWSLAVAESARQSSAILAQSLEAARRALLTMAILSTGSAECIAVSSLISWYDAYIEKNKNFMSNNSPKELIRNYSLHDYP